jgi:hypothetical protein
MMSTTLEAAATELSLRIDDIATAERAEKGEAFAVTELTAEELEQVSGARNNSASPKLLN